VASPCDERFYWVRRPGAEKVTRLEAIAARLHRALIGLRPIARGSIAGTRFGGSCLRRRDGVGDREQLGVIPEQFEHLAVECRLAVR
jgi:hypothetical protein